MTPAALHRLREIAAERRRLEDEEEQLLDALDAEEPAPVAQDDAGGAGQIRGPAFLSMKEAAYRLGLSYDAARMRAKRAGVTSSDGRDALIPIDWVNEQRVRKNPENVRTCSVAEQAIGER